MEYCDDCGCRVYSGASDFLKKLAKDKIQILKNKLIRSEL